MISEAEIRRLAAGSGVDPMVIDLDYSLGWFLAGWLAAVTRGCRQIVLQRRYLPAQVLLRQLSFFGRPGFHGNETHPIR
jgi:hypothetical protein